MRALVRSLILQVLILAAVAMCGLIAAPATVPLLAQEPARPAATPASTPASHVRLGRLIGVFDAVSGAPVDDVTITNTLTGLSAKTSATGTLTLFFVDTTAGFLRFQKLGYQPQLMMVANSERDTVPLTIVMEPAANRLNTVVTTARAVRGPADTVRRLELNGFYDRRVTTGAPSSAFVTGEKLQRLSLVSDLVALTGRELCTSNLYVNGVRVTAPSTRIAPGHVSRSYKSSPIDQLFDPAEVLAVEAYRDGEVPPEYNMTRPAGSPSCGATLIWTK